MRIFNSSKRYGVPAILLHWLIALIMIALLALGLYMVRLPISLEKLKFYGWHKEIGFLLLMLAMFRICWRLINVRPELALPTWEKLAALTAHWLFYLIMFALPITGWLITSAAGLPVSFFGLFVIPAIIPPNDQLLHLFELIHRLVAYFLIGLICLHTAAALKHHFINKDDILKRMIS